jgi:hypothetical protein
VRLGHLKNLRSKLDGLHGSGSTPVAEGQEVRVKTVEAEIDSLLREKEEIEKWAAVGSA